MIPPKYAPVLFGLILSGMMSCLVSGISTIRAVGLSPDFLMLWGQNWLFSWAVAFPIVLIVAPITRRLVALLVAQPKAD
ncbi:MAG: DUF2798 domain-containing protein [Mangrovicoccus sp.]